LRIDAEPPVGFQERIRDVFPIYRDGATQVGAVPNELLQLVRSAMPQALRQPRAFFSADEAWIITLASESLALEAKHYTHWEDFHERFTGPLAALVDEYRPAFYTRLGLRYRNVLHRDSLGLGDASWADLLRAEIAAELTAPEISNAVEQAASQTLVRLREFGSKVQIRHGLTDEQGEVCYVLDNDFYVEGQIEEANVDAVLQYFSLQAHRLFRWSISDRLHEALGPRATP